MKIQINKNENDVIQFNIDTENYKTLNFNNLVELANSYIANKLTSDNISIECETSCELYKKTIIDIFESIDSDTELTELLGDDSIIK